MLENINSIEALNFIFLYKKAHSLLSSRDDISMYNEMDVSDLTADDTRNLLQYILYSLKVSDSITEFRFTKNIEDLINDTGIKNLKTLDSKSRAMIPALKGFNVNVSQCLSNLKTRDFIKYVDTLVEKIPETKDLIHRLHTESRINTIDENVKKRTQERVANLFF